MIIHEPAASYSSVTLHAWEPGGRVWDIEAKPDPAGRFTFTLGGDIADPRTVAFKYRYTNGANSVWESDDYVRFIPLKDANQTFWTFDFTARVLIEDPNAPVSGPPLNAVTLHVLTRSRFAGGQVYAWNPTTGTHATFPESNRDRAALISTFQVPLQPWMQSGFLFKLVGPGNYWEPERSNRVWRSVDGAELWLKSGQISLRNAPFGLASVTIELLSPRSLSQPPVLVIEDAIEDFTDTLPVAADTPLDADLRQTTYTIQAYPNALYTLHTPDSSYAVPFLIWMDDPTPRPPLYGVLGNPGLTTTPSMRDAQVEVVIHSNPSTAFAGDLELDIYVGPAPKTLGPPKLTPYARVRATRNPADGAGWRAAFNALSGGIVQSFAIVGPNGLQENRPNGPVQFLRTFTAASGGPTVYHTADGVPGLAFQAGPTFQDVSTADRQRLMSIAFGAGIATSGVFAAWEMPHGAIVASDDVWFIVRAPHAMTAEVILLTEAGGPGTATPHPMALTPDLRYWGCRLPLAAAPHGTLYRFRFNGPDGVETLDPAGRWARDPGYLTVQDADRAVKNASGPATRVVDPARIQAYFHGSAWQTPGWEFFLIYEMHALRFTKRNKDAVGSPLAAFDQVTEELKPGKYLQKLPVTALELLPVHEFPQQQGWGYNPALFFAVDSFYGGPEGLVRVVRAAHDAGKGVLLDVVYNHMNESPLQIIAPDVYVDGATIWGDMPNYDHPAAFEFFRQATLYMWNAFQIDGFRFDCTEGIINGQWPNKYIIAQNPDGSWCTGSGGGWAFLGDLRAALRQAASASGRSWPYLVGENDPNNWAMTDPRVPGVLDGQWGFAELYPLGDMAKDDGIDTAHAITDAMEYPEKQFRPFYEVVRYGESHDSCSAQNSKLRIAARPPFGQGWRMAKAVATVSTLGNGVPMLFMGAEAGENIPFAFDITNLDEPARFLRLDAYEDLGDGHNRVYAWCRDVMGLRNDPGKELRGDDDQQTRIGRQTIAFTRRSGSLFVVVTFGTSDTRQDSRWLGLPDGGATYKEIFNSSWPVYQVEAEPNATNGGYSAVIRSGDVLNFPFVGAVVLERR